jgi:uncharacterized YigZ family protein
LSYKTIRNRCEASFIEKKSEFIGYLCPVTTEQEAIDFINEIRAMHRKATHNCYAYILRDNNTARHSDDGEPGGTAGKPILEVITGSGLRNIVIVVTRYFGGILLGGGGLIRAYTQAASDALVDAKIVSFDLFTPVSMTCNYSEYDKLIFEINKVTHKMISTDYTDKVELKFNVKSDVAADFERRITDVFGGRVKPVFDEEIFDFLGENEE